MRTTTTTGKLVLAMLDQPDVVEKVGALDPGEFEALVLEVGLEDAGEILALATPQQLLHLVDASLWETHGIDEAFDHTRFATWLEVMFEGGEEMVATRLAELPEETVTLVLTIQAHRPLVGSASQSRKIAGSRRLPGRFRSESRKNVGSREGRRCHK